MTSLLAVVDVVEAVVVAVVELLIHAVAAGEVVVLVLGAG